MPQRDSTQLQELGDSLEMLTKRKDRHVMLCGDFNCPDIDWSSLATTSPTTRQVHQDLIDLSVKHQLSQMQESPTRQENVLDLVFTSNASLVKSSTTVPGLSDHDIVVVDSDIKPHYNRQKPRKCHQFRKANWDTLRNQCQDISDEISTLYDQGKDAEHLWDHFKTSLQQAIDKNIPSKIAKGNKSPPWLNRQLRRMLRRKTRLHRQARKTKNWGNYRHFQRECKRAYRRAEWSYVNETIQKGLEESNTKPFWKYVKSKQQDNIGVSPLKSKGQLLIDGKSKAEALVDQFSSVFTRITNTVMPPVNKTVNEDIPDISIGEAGVLKLLSNLQTAKASGPDAIPNMVLKECAPQLARGVALIFQRSLDTAILPSDWVNANIAPVFKKGDRHLPENYRPVSLTSVLSKILEHIVCHHMLEHFDRNNVLTDLNHGFRAGYSCETQLATTIDDLSTNTDNGLQTDIIILDFSKAFDTVPHQELLHKLDAYGIRGGLHKWIKAFLCNRQMRVVVEGECSRDAPVESGVPQGTVLGPLLFLCHVNDMPDAVTSSIRLFADDCLLYRVIRSVKDHIALQEDLKRLEEWATAWGMRFNAKKCYVLRTRPKSSHFYQLDNTVLKEVTNTPYLGVTISSDLKWGTHINNICKKASSTLGFIRRNLRHCPALTRKSAYISLVRSTLEYGAIIWDPFLKSDIEKVERIQRRAARFITGDYRTRTPGHVTEMLRNLDLPLLQERRKDLRLTFLFKVVEGLIPAIPPQKYLVPIRNRRRVVPKKFTNFEATNIIENSETNNQACFKVRHCNTEVHRQSFFTRTVRDWNKLTDEQVSSPSVECFKTRLHNN